ncbi:MAG: addiction module antidote protein, HigA family, partial [Bifidobacterium choerinum]
MNGKRAITVRTAFMLSRAFGTSPEFWLNLQRDYDVLRFDAHSVQ